jgi:DNA-binding LacI/PurR family transcriptional regulator
MSEFSISIQPKFKQVKDWIIEQIKSGEMPDGSFLPSETDLCNLLKVGRTTVRAAIEELNKENIIVKQQGRRSIVNASNIRNEEKQRMRLAWLSQNGLPGIEEIHFQIYNHLLREAEKNDTDVLFISLQNDSDMEWFIKHSENFDGIIITGILNSKILPGKVINRLQEFDNLLVVDDIIDTPAKYFVFTDNYLGGRIAAEYFLNNGFSNPVIGIRMQKDTFEPIQTRIDGFCDCMRENGMRFKKIELSWSPQDYTGSLKRLNEFISENPETDAIFCSTDVMAINLMFALKSMGIRIPSDISILGFDDIARAKETFPGLSTIVQSTKKIAEKAFEILKNIHESKTIKSKRVEIKPYLKLRDSTISKIS